MRGSAYLVGLLLILVSVSFVYAGTASYLFPGFPNQNDLWSTDMDSDTLCRVQINPDRDLSDTEYWMYSGSGGTCQPFLQKDQILFDWVDGTTYQYKGFASVHSHTPAKGYPWIKIFGVQKDVGNTNFGGSDFRAIVDVQYSSKKDLPTSRYLVLEAAICVESLELDFVHRTNLPDFDQTRIVVDKDDDSFEKCTDRVFAEEFSYYGELQGLYIDSAQAYEFPLFCDDFDVIVTEGEHDTWDSWRATYDLKTSTHVRDEDGYRVLERDDGEDRFEFKFNYDVDSGIMKDYTLLVNDASSKAGGISFQFFCDPFDPYSRGPSCTALDHEWKDDIGCCYEDVDGTTKADSSGDQYYCLDGFWGLIDPVSCPSGNGERLPSDPLDYCCTSGAVDEDLPHSNPDTNRFFCVVDDEGTGILDKTKLQEKDTWAYDETSWRQCTPELSLSSTANPSHSEYLCTQYVQKNNGDDELDPDKIRWQECKCATQYGNFCGDEHRAGDDWWYCAPPDATRPTSYWTKNANTLGACDNNQRINDQCCLKGKFFVDVETDDNDFDITKICWNGEIFDEETSPLGKVYMGVEP